MKDKKIFSLVLICMLMVSIIFSGTDVSAARKAGLRVTYKGKTVTLYKNPRRDSHKNTVSLRTVQKAWGKGRSKKMTGCTTYTWKTKKTKIEISDNSNPGRVSGSIIDIKDKNGSLAGIKVGMTKAKALKKLKKTFGAKHVKMQKALNGESFIRIDNLGAINSFRIKSGKITSLYYFCS